MLDRDLSLDHKRTIGNGLAGTDADVMRAPALIRIIHLGCTEMGSHELQNLYQILQCGEDFTAV